MPGGPAQIKTSTKPSSISRDNELNSQQTMATKFEDFLLDHATQLGMRCTRNPKLGNGTTPDFRVKHKGRICYVEATHLQPHPAFEEKRGEGDLKRFLNEQLPQDRAVLLSYEDDDAERKLTDPLSRNDKGVLQLARWARGTDLEAEGTVPAEVFSIKDVGVEAQLFIGSMELTDKVGWRRGYSSWGNNSEALRKSLRAKYHKYTSSPNSLGETPLIVAIFAEMTLQQEMEEALYGQIEQKIILRRVPVPVIEPRIERVYDGVWLNPRNGTLEPRHQHLAGVWFFQSMRKDREKPCLFPNPFRKDLDYIVPAPILSDSVFKRELLPTVE